MAKSLIEQYGKKNISQSGQRLISSYNPITTNWQGETALPVFLAKISVLQGLHHVHVHAAAILIPSFL